MRAAGQVLGRSRAAAGQVRGRRRGGRARGGARCPAAAGSAARDPTSAGRLLAGADGGPRARGPRGTRGGRAGRARPQFHVRGAGGRQRVPLACVVPQSPGKAAGGTLSQDAAPRAPSAAFFLLQGGTSDLDLGEQEARGTPPPSCPDSLCSCAFFMFNRARIYPHQALAAVHPPQHLV